VAEENVQRWCRHLGFDQSADRTRFIPVMLLKAPELFIIDWLISDQQFEQARLKALNKP
jgi:hypothetical protein